MDLDQRSSKLWYRIIFDIQWARMSTVQAPKQDNKVSKANEKKNTDNWKEKQAQKKKAKEQQQVKEGGDGGATAKKQDKKDKKKNKQKEEQSRPEEKTEKEETKVKIVEAPAKVYKKLSTIHDVICEKNPNLIGNRSQQIILIQKAVQGLLSENNIIIHLGTSKFTKQCQFVEIPNFTNHPESDFVCRYQDVSCLLEDEVDKVVCEAQVIFGNGSALIKKGYSNIIYVAELYKVPVVVSCGSWNYCGCVPHNQEQLQRLYGPNILQDFDWINSSSINLVAMEFGAIHPSQITEHITQGYKAYGFHTVSW